MQVFKTLIRRVALMVIVFTISLNLTAYAKNCNPTRQELEKMIEEVATRRAIPAVFLKAIARVETFYQHFDKNGNVNTGSNGAIGLMMINNKSGVYDNERLKYDIKYNIEVGADMLLSKWNMSSSGSVSKVGNMDPNILENWYFAIWAYNGWAQSNNPNMIPYQCSSWVKRCTFQDMIYDICKDEYNQDINNIDVSYLPKSGKPSRSLVVPTPRNVNYGGIILYDVGDLIETDSIKDSIYLRKNPSGDYSYKIKIGQLGQIVEGPVLKDGYYWYKMYINDQTSGWIERNWITRVGDAKNGVYPFKDISYHWSRKNVMKLYKKGKLEKSEMFMPNKFVNREEFCVFLSKAADLENIVNNQKKSSQAQDNCKQLQEKQNGQNAVKNSVTLPFSDKAKISKWAEDHVKKVYNAGMLDIYSGKFRPKDNLTRKEAAMMLACVFAAEDKTENGGTENINKTFADLGKLKENEKAAIKTVYKEGLMSGKTSGKFCPTEYLSRAEAATIMVKITERIEYNNKLQ